MSYLKSYFNVPPNSFEIICTKKQKILKRESIVLSDDKMDCMIPIRIDKLPFGKKRILYDLTGTVSLRRFLQNILFSKKLFIRLIRNIIQSYKNILHLKFDISKLIYLADRVFIDPRNWKIGYIYVVADPFYGSDNIINLLSEITCLCVFDSTEKVSFVNELLAILDSTDSVFDVEQFLNFLEDESNVFGGRITCCSSCGSPIGPKDRACPLCGRSINRSSVSTTNKHSSLEAKAYLNDGMRSIPINTSPFTVGKSETNNLVIKKEEISRSHAQIIRDQSNYFLVDLSSTNGTYVNGGNAIPGKKYCLKNGTEIKFVDVKYLFVLK